MAGMHSNGIEVPLKLHIDGAPRSQQIHLACVEGYSLLHYAAECVQDPQAAELVEEKADNTIYHNISFERGEHKESEKQKNINHRLARTCSCPLTCWYFVSRFHRFVYDCFERAELCLRIWQDAANLFMVQLRCKTHQDKIQLLILDFLYDQSTF